VLKPLHNDKIYQLFFFPAFKNACSQKLCEGIDLKVDATQVEK
jgi:hypothetical protein